MIGLAMGKTIRPGCQLAVLCWIDILQRYLWRSISCFLPANRRALYSRLYSSQGLWKKFLFQPVVHERGQGGYYTLRLSSYLFVGCTRSSRPNSYDHIVMTT